MDKIKSFFQNQVNKLKDKNHIFWYFMFLLVLAILMSVVVLAENNFTLPLSGDYTQQQIPFYTNGYDDWWKFFRTGEFPLWDSNTMLGASNIGSNSFYYFLNPFFLPILIFPRSMIPQGLAILMLLKMALAGLSFRAYLKYMGVNERTSRLVAIAYAFCGWNLFYLWFNHFLEVCVVFPLILLGIEKLLKEKKPFLLIISLFLMGLSNYFFLVFACFAGVIYAGFRFFQTWKSNKGKDKAIIIGLGFLAFLTGLMMCAFVLLPCISVVTGGARVQNANFLENLKEAFSTKNFDALFNLLFKFNHEKKKYYPLISFLFPVISDFNSILIANTGYDNTLSGLFIYTPMMLLLIPSMIESFRKRKISHIVAMSFFIISLFTPFMYYLYHGFTLDYGRWEIFVVTSMLLFIAKNFEKIKEFPKWYFDISAVILLVLMGWIVGQAIKMQTLPSTYEIGERIYIVIYQVVVLAISYVVLRFNFKKEKLYQYVTGVISLEVIVMGTLLYQNHGISKYQNLAGGINNYNDQVKVVKNINKQDSDYFRIFNTTADKSTNNLGMREGYNGVGAFHSLYNFEIQDFLWWSHIPYHETTWSMGVHEKRANLETFLGVKYYITRNSDYNLWVDGVLQPFDVNLVNVPYGYIHRPDLSTEITTVFENTNYIQLGYAFDNIIRVNNSSVFKSTYSADHILRAEEAYLSGAIIKNEDLYATYTEDSLGFVSDTTLNEGFEDFDIKDYNSPSYARKSIKGVRYDCSNGGYDPLKPTDKSSCSIIPSAKESEIPYKNGVTHYELTPYTGSTFCSLSGSGNDCYISLHLSTDRHAWVYLYDESNELITMDYHQWIDQSYKFLRGFYSDRPVAKIVVRPAVNYDTVKNHNYISSSGFVLYEEYYSTYKARLDKLKANEFSDIKVTTNTMRFKTNYTDKKFIVLSTPYDVGWKATTTINGVSSPIKIIKAQGGFIGFFAATGEVEYYLSYFTPQLTNGIYLSLCGFFLFGVTYGAFAYLEKKKKNKQKPENEDHNDASKDLVIDAIS